jgi:hypothetical protein
MLIPSAHSWTLRQRWLIIGTVLVGVMSFGALIYSYERYHRGPRESVFFGTWEIGKCIDCANFITFEPNHNVVGFSDSMGREWLDYHGRWYAGGQILVIHYDSEEEARSVVMRILDITPDTIRVRWGGEETRLKRSTRRPPQASNQALERTAARRTFAFQLNKTVSARAALALSGGRSAWSR